MNLDIENNFRKWLQIIIDTRLNGIYNTYNLPTNNDELKEFVKKLQISMTEVEFENLVVYSDTYCNCEEYSGRHYSQDCLYCKLYVVIENIATQVYLDIEPVEVDSLKDLH